MFVSQTPAPQNSNKTLCTSGPGEVADVLSLHIILSFSVVFACVCISRPKNQLLLCSVTVQQSHDNVGMMQLHGI